MSKDKERLALALAAAALIYDKSLSSDTLNLYVKLLADYPVDDVLLGLASHLKDPERGRWWPKPGDIIAMMPGTKGPMAAAEAWEVAMQLRVYDEDASVVVPKAILLSFPFATWGTGDKVAARMAFKGAYERNVKRGDAFDLELSIGWDAGGRDAAVVEAERAGAISNEQAEVLLQDLREMGG